VATQSCRTARPLRAAEIDQLVAAYEAGATVFELATRFNIHRTTVGRHLKERGIDTRPPALDATALPKLTQLYKDGHSIATIAQHYGVSKNAVRDRLLAAGLTLRPRGWPKNVAGSS
jgi:transposase